MTALPVVAVLFEHPTLHGGERSFLSVAARVREAGYRLVALAPSGGALAASLDAEGVERRVVELGSAGGTRTLEERRRVLSRALVELRPDLVHANSLATARIAGPVVDAIGLPSIGHLRDIVRPSRTAVSDLDRLDRLIAVSAAVRDWHVAGGLDAARVRVVPNGVDLARFRPRPRTGSLHRELGLPSGAPLVLSIGQLVARKGVDVFLRAARRIAERRADARFVVVGERHSAKEEAVEHEAELRRLAREEPLGDRVSFLGTRHDVADLLAEADVLLHTARQEPLGRVLLEAAATGLAVVATSVGGTPEIFPPDSWSAVLVEPKEDARAADAVLRLLRDRSAREALGRAARRRVEEAFDAREAGRRLAEQYATVLAMRGR